MRKAPLTDRGWCNNWPKLKSFTEEQGVKMDGSSELSSFSPLSRISVFSTDFLVEWTHINLYKSIIQIQA